MAVEIVRVIRTWDVEVEAEYGDDHAALKAKVTEAWLDKTTPEHELRVILPNYEKIPAHVENVSVIEEEVA
jgi:hypothetical protein